MKKSSKLAIANIYSILGKAWPNVIPVLLISTSVVFYINYIIRNNVTIFDDAYIFIRYTNNLLSGYGLAWNPKGMQTYGVTSILYLALIVILRGTLVTVDKSIILTTASASMALLSLVALTFTCARFAISKYLKNAYITLAAILLPIFILSPVFRYHAVSGMGTTLSLLCNTILIFSTLRWTCRDKRYSMLLTIFASYFAYLARPDNIIYAYIFPLLCIWVLLNINRKTKAIYFIIGLSLILAIDTILKYVILGDPLPLPFYAKTRGYYEGYSAAYKWNPVNYVFDFATFVFPFLIIIIFSFTKDSLKLLAAFLVPVIITFGYYSSILQIMGWGARYYFPSVPFFVISSCLIVDQYIQKGDEIKESINTNLIRLIAILFIVVLVSQPDVKTKVAKVYEQLFVPPRLVYSSSTRYTTLSKQSLPHLGWWTTIEEFSEIATDLPEGTKVALSEYGLVGARAPHIHIIDPLGLHDPFFAHNGFSSSVFFEREPELIWFPHGDYTKILSSILDSREFWEYYEFYPGAFDYGLAIRKDSAHFQIIYDTVKKSWQENYGTLNMSEYLAKPIMVQ